jgi:hypothetical protein
MPFWLFTRCWNGPYDQSSKPNGRGQEGISKTKDCRKKKRMIERSLFHPCMYIYIYRVRNELWSSALKMPSLKAEASQCRGSCSNLHTRISYIDRMGGAKSKLSRNEMAKERSLLIERDGLAWLRGMGPFAVFCLPEDCIACFRKQVS